MASSMSTEDKAIYNPLKPAEDYHPKDDAIWKPKEKVPYLALARTFQEIEAASNQQEIVDILSNFFRSVIYLSSEDLLPCVYLCLNQFEPSFKAPPVRAVGEKVLRQLLKETTGKNVKASTPKMLVDLAETSISETVPQHQLTVSGVFTNLKELMPKIDADPVKMQLMKELYMQCRPIEAKYLFRALMRNMQLGLGDVTIFMALGQSATLTPTNTDITYAALEWSSEVLQKKYIDATLEIKRAYSAHPNYETIISNIILRGVEDLYRHCNVLPGVPVKAMLALPARTVKEVLTRFDGAEFLCDWKYDGERCQIHIMEGGDVNVYSRNSFPFNYKYPDIVAHMLSALKPGVTSAIIDAEAVGVDNKTKEIVSYHTLVRRKIEVNGNFKKLEIGACVYAFDLLYLNGKPLINETLRHRRELLHQSFNVIHGEFRFVQSNKSSDSENIMEYMEESIRGKCEGLMVKKLDENAMYSPGERSQNWLKLKSDYLVWIGDSFDLVVMGGYSNSENTPKSYDGFLLGCYNDETDEFQSICKIINIEFGEEPETAYEYLVISGPKASYQYSSAMVPDHWFEPSVVWEVKATSLAISNVHKASLGLVDTDKGVVIEFPRFLRNRPDKSPRDCTTSQQVAEMYESQVLAQEEASVPNKRTEDLEEGGNKS